MKYLSDSSEEKWREDIRTTTTTSHVMPQRKLQTTSPNSISNRDETENINTAAYLAKKTLENLIESTDSEDEKGHSRETRIQKIFNYNFKCVIAVFSVVCVAVNVL